LENRVGTLIKRKGRKYWYLNVKEEGNWRQLSTGCTSKAEAEKVKQQIRENIAQGRNPFDFGKRDTLPLGELFEAYLGHCELNNAPLTATNRRNYCKRLLDYFGDIPAGSVKRGDVFRYKEARQKEGFSNRTINEELKTLRQAFNYGIKSEQLDANPAKSFGRLNEKSRKIKVLSEDELKTLFDWCKENDPLLYDIAIIAFHTGLRRGDILSLDTGDIDFKNRTIQVIMSKTNEMITKPVNKAVYKVLKRKATGGWVFPSGNGSDSGHIVSIRKRFARALRATELDFEFRDLRANHAIHLRQSGADRYVVLRSLGHEEETVMFKHYMDLVENEEREALNKLPGAG